MDKIVKGYPNWDVPLNKNIDEYNETMGNAELLTEDKTVKGAINEIKTANDEIIEKIKDDTQINTADISNLKTSVAQNTSSLNAKANQADLNTANTNISALQTSVGTSLTLSNGTKVWATAQRINKTVTIYIAVSIALTSNVAICTLPTGFTPLQPIQGIASENASGSYQTGFRIDNTGVITLYSNSQSTVRTYIINVTYVTA